jgi:hypothetical protein
VADLYRVGGVSSLDYIDSNGLFMAGLSSVLDVGPQLDDEKTGLFRSRPATGDFGQASNLL